MIKLSRSYKKYPSCKCEKSCKFGKKQANRKVRHFLQDIPSGGSYKKLYDSWDICDFKVVYFSFYNTEYKRK